MARWFEEGYEPEKRNPIEDLNRIVEEGRAYRENPLLVPESQYDTAVRIAKENNIKVKFEPVKAVWKTVEK